MLNLWNCLSHFQFFFRPLAHSISLCTHFSLMNLWNFKSIECHSPTPGYRIITQTNNRISISSLVSIQSRESIQFWNYKLAFPMWCNSGTTGRDEGIRRNLIRRKIGNDSHHSCLRREQKNLLHRTSITTKKEKKLSLAARKKNVNVTLMSNIFFSSKKLQMIT